MASIRRMLAVGMLCLMPMTIQARLPETSSGWPSRVTGSPGDFDYFLLSLSIAPSFCTLSPANQAKQECRSLTEAAFQETPLTVHGLWPNRAGVSVNRQPQDCPGRPYVEPAEDVQAALRRYMPGGSGLAHYEWRKHGTCSGLSSDRYFAAVAKLAQHANDTIGAVMRSKGMLGHSIVIADLLAAVGREDATLAPAIVVDCRHPRGGGEALVEEIRITLSKDLRPIPASSVGLGQNSGCPGGRGRVPAARG
jgi:ribonuclease T2